MDNPFWTLNQEQKIGLVSIVQEKAFDCVDHKYFFLLCCKDVVLEKNV